MKKLLLILNPCSGKKKASHALADVVNVFNRGGYDVPVYIAAARGDATKVVAQRAPEFDLVVCAGGDGTFNETISGLLAGGHDTPIGYLPAGSTNDFASSLHLSKNLVEAARDIVEGTPRRLDVGRFNDRYFSYVASFGAFTRASYATSQNVKNALGHLAYILSGIKELAYIRSRRLRFTLDDGSGTDRQILSGIAKFYKPEELLGKTLVAIINLPPRKMMGVESCGMLLSAVHEEKVEGDATEERLNLLMVSDRIPAGAKLY